MKHPERSYFSNDLFIKDDDCFLEKLTCILYQKERTIDLKEIEIHTIKSKLLEASKKSLSISNPYRIHVESMSNPCRIHVESIWRPCSFGFYEQSRIIAKICQTYRSPRLSSSRIRTAELRNTMTAMEQGQMHALATIKKRHT